MERRHPYGAGIAISGVFLAAVQLFHGLQQTGRPLVLAFEAGPFVLVGLTLTYVGYRVAAYPAYEEDIERILAWGSGGVILFVSVGALLLFSQRVFLGTLDRATYVAIDHVTVGAVVGILVGIYDARSRETMRDLQQERDRVEAFGNKAADVNNYGRAFNRSDSIDEVSAFCIQAMQALLGVTEVAVLALDDDDLEVVDDTILNVSEKTFRSLGDRARDADQAGVVTHPEVPDAVSGRASDAISLHLAEIDGMSFVLIALTTDETIIEDENVQLLEMLAAHAGTAIDGIYDRTEPAAASS